MLLTVSVKRVTTLFVFIQSITETVSCAIALLLCCITSEPVVMLVQRMLKTRSCASWHWPTMSSSSYEMQLRIFTTLNLLLVCLISVAFSLVIYHHVMLLSHKEAALHIAFHQCHPPISNRHHLSYDDCLENKGRLQDCSCSIGSYHCIQCYAHIL